MRSASFAGRSCSEALLVLAVLICSGPIQGSGPVDEVRPAAAPTIAATTPSPSQVDVALTDPVEVRFSEAMNTSSLLYAILPLASVTISWPAADILHLTPDAPGLANCTVYEVAVGGKDVDEGLSLAPGGTPNPWSFMTACDRPYIVSTVPANGANNVRPGDDVVVAFSEPMDCQNIEIAFNPTNLTSPRTSLTSCDSSRTVWTFRFTGGTSFYSSTTYVASVTGQSNDTLDDLVPSLAANPWTFRVNAPPSVSKPTLSLPGCLAPSTVQTIGWTMVDGEDATTAISVRIFFWDGNSTWEPVFGPGTGFGSPAFYGWSLPSIDITTRVRVVVTDTAGASAENESDTFRIDRGPPSVSTSTYPSHGATGVPVNQQITIPFSEPMNSSSVQSSISSSPPFVAPRFLWLSSDNVTITVETGGLQYGSTYEVSIAATATDTCAPGRPLTGPYVFRFTTEPPRPSAPLSLVAISFDETSATLQWSPVTTYITGDPILGPARVTYRVYRATGGGLSLPITDTDLTSFRDTGLQPRTDYYYRVVAIVNSTMSPPPFAPLHVQTQAPFFERSDGQLSILAALAAVGVAAILGAEMRRRSRRTAAKVQLEAEIRDVVAQVRKVRMERNPEQRRKEEAELQQHFRALVEGDEASVDGYRADPRLEGLYRALAQALVQSPEVDVSRGRRSLDARLGDLAPRLRDHGASYRLLSEAEASAQSELFVTLPESARKALLLVYFYGLEEYLNNRLRGLVPVGATVLLGDRGHINVRRRGWEAQWAGLSLGNLLYVMDHNTHLFVVDLDRWIKDVEPLLREAVDARNRTAHPSRAAPPLDRVQDLVFRAIPAIESILKWPKAPAAA